MAGGAIEHGIAIVGVKGSMAVLELDECAAGTSSLGVTGRLAGGASDRGTTRLGVKCSMAAIESNECAAGIARLGINDCMAGGVDRGSPCLGVKGVVAAIEFWLGIIFLLAARGLAQRTPARGSLFRDQNFAAEPDGLGAQALALEIVVKLFADPVPPAEFCDGVAIEIIGQRGS